MKKIAVLVKPRAKKPDVTERADGSFIVAVAEPPTEGRANDAVVTALADHLHLPKSRVCLVAGAKSKRKVFTIR